MQITVNDKPVDFQGVTVAQLVAQLGLPETGVAVATRSISGDSETRLTLPKGLFAIRAAAGSQSATMKIVAK